MAKSSTNPQVATCPEPIIATGRYETVTSGSDGSVFVYDPEGYPFASANSETAKDIAETLNTVEFGCSCGGSCGDSCKCK